jgi:hypothetical protein
MRGGELVVMAGPSCARDRLTVADAGFGTGCDRHQMCSQIDNTQSVSSQERLTSTVHLNAVAISGVGNAELLTASTAGGD